MKNEPKIYFGPNDDSAKPVNNVIIILKAEGERINCRDGFANTTSDELLILKNCTEIWLAFTKDNQLVDELYIPLHNVKEIRVNHFPKVNTNVKPADT